MLKIIKKLRYAICCVLIFNCFSFVYAQENNNGKANSPIITETFLQDPFGFEPNIKNFSNKLHKRIRIRKYTFKNKQGYSKLDTIYKFYKGKSELFIDKPYKGKQKFFAGVIKNKKIGLNYGMKKGMKKKSFLNIFSDLNDTEGDTIKLSGKNIFNNYTFIFKRNKLYSINIDNKKQKNNGATK